MEPELDVKGRYWSSVNLLLGISQYIPDVSTISEDWEKPSQYIRGIEETHPSRSLEKSEGGSQYKRYRLMQRLASALANIGCAKEGPDHVFACAFEQRYTTKERFSDTKIEYVIRVARNSVMTEEDVQDFQSLIDAALTSVLAINHIPPKSESGYRSLLSKQRSFLLELIINRCEAKIRSLYKAPFQKWVDEISQTNYTSTSWYHFIRKYFSDEESRKWYYRFRDIARNTDDNNFLKHNIHAVNRLFEAFGTRTADKRTDAERSDVSEGEDIVSGAATKRRDAPSLLDELDAIWKAWEIPVQGSASEQDARESDTFEKGDLERSACYQYLNKLRRYYISATRITEYLLKTHRKKLLHKGMFKVETVSGFETRGDAVMEQDHSTLASFVSTFRSIGYSMDSFDTRKIQKVKDTWTRNRASMRLIHCEMQLVVFYSLNPHLIPLGSFIAVSKFCCFMCNQVIKKLSDPMDRTIHGNPIVFSVAGTHGTFSANWFFPNLSLIIRHNHTRTSTARGSDTKQFKNCADPRCEHPSISRNGFQQLTARFDTVAEALARDLRVMVRKGFPSILKSRAPSDSDGFSSSKTDENNTNENDADSCPDFEDRWREEYAGGGSPNF